MRLLYAVPWPSQAFYTKDAVGSLADLKGKKMRTYNAQTARLATLLGTVPTTEIPQAFSADIIDTMFTAGETGVTMRAGEYTRFYYDTRAWVPKNVVLANRGNTPLNHPANPRTPPTSSHRSASDTSGGSSDSLSRSCCSECRASTAAAPGS
jgi:hypothetical protein